MKKTRMNHSRPSELMDLLEDSAKRTNNHIYKVALALGINTVGSSAPVIAAEILKISGQRELIWPHL